MQITRKVKSLIGILIKCNETHISWQLPNFEVSSPFHPWVCALELLIKTLLKFSSFLCSLDRENCGKLFHFISFPSIFSLFLFRYHQTTVDNRFHGFWNRKFHPVLFLILFSYFLLKILLSLRLSQRVSDSLGMKWNELAASMAA